MDPWIWQGGYPLISVTVADDATLRFSQRRYAPSHPDDETKWAVPLLIRQTTPDGRETTDAILVEAEGATLPMASADAVADPYLVITSEGRLTWMVDGYTLDGHPYSRDWIEGLRTDQLHAQCREGDSDAYDGSIHLYVFDAATRSSRLAEDFSQDCSSPPRQCPPTCAPTRVSGDPVPRAGGDLSHLPYARSAGLL